MAELIAVNKGEDNIKKPVSQRIQAIYWFKV